MKKILAVSSVIGLLLITQFVYAAPLNKEDYETTDTFYTEQFSQDKYIFIDYGEKSNKYIEKSTLRVSEEQGKIIIDFWLVSTYKIGGLLDTIEFLQKSGLEPTQAQTVSYEKAHFKMAKNFFITSVIGVSYYDNDDRLIYRYFNGMNYTWQDIIPNSYGNIMYNAIFDYLNQ